MARSQDIGAKPTGHHRRPQGKLKTSLIVDLAISIGTGKPFLGEFAGDNAMRVAVLSGEGGGAAQETAARLCSKRRPTGRGERALGL